MLFERIYSGVFCNAFQTWGTFLIETPSERQPETFAKSPKPPPRHLGDFSWPPSSNKPPKPWLPNTSTASHYWSWIKWLIGSWSNSTWIVKEPVTLEAIAAVPPILSPVFPKRYGNLKQMPSELPFQTALCPNDSISSAFFTFNNQICPNHRHPSRHRSHRQQKMLPIRHWRHRATAAFDFRTAQQPVQQHIRNPKQQRVFQTLQPKNQPRPHGLPSPIPTTILYRFRAMLK